MDNTIRAIHGYGMKDADGLKAPRGIESGFRRTARTWRAFHDQKVWRMELYRQTIQ